MSSDSSSKNSKGASRIPLDSQTHALQCLELWGGTSAVTELVSVPGIDAWVHSEPFQQSSDGGDVHYVSMCGDGKVTRFALADVSGHGADVAGLAGKLRTLMRKNIVTADQSRLVKQLNSEFGQMETDGHFATALLITYWAPGDAMIVTNAGHPRPLRYTPSQARWSILIGEELQAGGSGNGRRISGLSNLPLGVIEPTEYEQFAFSIERGEILVMYTDALIEAKNPLGAQLGEAGLLAMVESIGPMSPPELGRALLQAVADFRQGQASDDDLTLLILHHNATDPPRLSFAEWVGVFGRWLVTRV